MKIQGKFFILILSVTSLCSISSPVILEMYLSCKVFVSIKWNNVCKALISWLFRLIVKCLINASTYYFVFSLLWWFSELRLFFFGCIGSSLLRAGFLQLRRAGATLRRGARASHCGGFSCCGTWALGMWASVVAALGSCDTRALECRLSSCGTWALLLRGMWDLPGPEIEPVSPALGGRFLTTAPPGKSPSELHLK